MTSRNGDLSLDDVTLLYATSAYWSLDSNMLRFFSSPGEGRAGDLSRLGEESFIVEVFVAAQAGVESSVFCLGEQGAC